MNSDDLILEARKGHFVADYEMWTSLDEDAPRVLAATLEVLGQALGSGSFVLYVGADEYEFEGWARNCDFKLECGSLDEALRALCANFGYEDLAEALTELALYGCDPASNPNLFEVPKQVDPSKIVWALTSDAPNPSVNAILVRV